MLDLNLKGRLWNSEVPVVMGIINCTPDSFYKGSRLQEVDEIVMKAENMFLEGAQIIDLGGQSTRPGSELVGAKTELERVLPAIEQIMASIPHAILSIDTFYAEVALKSLEAGVCIVNDISSGLEDPEILSVAANFNAPYICMHMKGKPATMQNDPKYNNIIEEVIDFFIERIHYCTEKGVKDLIIDPGFGFGKTLEHNYTLLKGLSSLLMLSKPILVGMSRKSMIYKLLNIQPEDALNGSTIANTIALIKGASILRVHDVKAASEVITIHQKYKSA